MSETRHRSNTGSPSTAWEEAAGSKASAMASMKPRCLDKMRAMKAPYQSRNRICDWMNASTS